MTKKTGDYYYSLLQRGVKSKVKNYTKININEISYTDFFSYWNWSMNIEYRSMNEFITSLFVLSKTKEGLNYWNRIILMYNNK